MISNSVTGAAAYAALQANSPAGDETPAAGGGSFSTMLKDAVTGLTDLGKDADTKSVQALSGAGSMTDVVMAVSKAEMALQASVAVRDKMISAYQDVMRMTV